MDLFNDLQTEIPNNVIEEPSCGPTSMERLQTRRRASKLQRKAKQAANKASPSELRNYHRCDSIAIRSQMSSPGKIRLQNLKRAVRQKQREQKARGRAKRAEQQAFSGMKVFFSSEEPNLNITDLPHKWTFGSIFSGLGMGEVLFLVLSFLMFGTFVFEHSFFSLIFKNNKNNRLSQ